MSEAAEFEVAFEDEDALLPELRHQARDRQAAHPRADDDEIEVAAGSLHWPARVHEEYPRA